MMRLLLTILAASAAVAMLPAHAGALAATATDKTGAMMSNVVIYATPADGAALPPAAAHATASISQENLQFTPYVTVVRTGTAIRFPNNDKIEHHVKSFSSAKEFEYKIYDKGTPPPVVFDKPGVVIVYCMLHGWMRAYVLVVDTPHFNKTMETGMTMLEGLPDGTYEVRAWHPDMGTVRQPLLQRVKISGGVPQPLAFDFDFVPKKLKGPK
ncbi:cupredoxin domain-containing protein [Noviherbaspirillum galbum]|uniref:Methylamine utilization protein n=1 Tax=Noviherbaspirillum galbum TaxID=2709383 RepID=A0A6B3SHE5_9BURK|nr:methylamine utilization protein [Noviherbaspirillum galbum]NEX60088.1 methylamine utilization protein [Noviherbaspirillum galbum]